MAVGRDTLDDQPTVTSWSLLVSGQLLDPQSTERAIDNHHGREIDAVLGVLGDCSASDELSV